MKYTDDEAAEHAKVFCGRAALVEVAVDRDRRLPLCGSSFDHALVRLRDVEDLFSRMNSEALRDGWVFFGPTHGTTVVFKLGRNAASFQEAPTIAFVPHGPPPPLDGGSEAVRLWLAKQAAVVDASVSAEGGAIIEWGPSGGS